MITTFPASRAHAIHRAKGDEYLDISFPHLHRSVEMMETLCGFMRDGLKYYSNHFTCRANTPDPDEVDEEQVRLTKVVYKRDMRDEIPPPMQNRKTRKVSTKRRPTKQAKKPKATVKKLTKKPLKKCPVGKSQRGPLKKLSKKSKTSEDNIDECTANIEQSTVPYDNFEVDNCNEQSVARSMPILE